MYLYDTNVISEFRKRQKNPNVIKFHAEITRKDQPILLSVITYGEILKGINILKRNRDFAQADRVEQWFDSALKPIQHLALPFDLRCAKIWGQLMAINQQNIEDKQLAATAIAHDLILVTRNVKDIADTGVKFINPFEPLEN